MIRPQRRHHRAGETWQRTRGKGDRDPTLVPNGHQRRRLGILAAAAAIAASAGCGSDVDRADPRSTSDGFTVAYVNGDTPSACTLASGVQLRKMKRKGLCSNDQVFEPAVEELRLIATCRDGGEFVYAVSPDLPMKMEGDGEPLSVGNLIWVTTEKSGSGYAVQVASVYTEPDPTEFMESGIGSSCTSGWTARDQLIDT